MKDVSLCEYTYSLVHMLARVTVLSVNWNHWGLFFLSERFVSTGTSCIKAQNLSDVIHDFSSGGFPQLGILNDSLCLRLPQNRRRSLCLVTSYQYYIQRPLIYIQLL